MKIEEGQTSCARCFYSTLFKYETPKIVQIESKTVGLLYSGLLLFLSAAIIIYVFILNNGYQHIDQGARVSSLSKLKGVTYMNSNISGRIRKVFDTADFFTHPAGDGSFFVTTNVIITGNQKRGICPEEQGIGADCREDADCEAGQSYILGHGITTGMCNLTTETCMVEAWCPIENDTLPNGGLQAVLKDTKDFTVFIKDHVYFPYYNVTRSNVIESINPKELHDCRYHPERSPYCPIFRLGDIVSLAMEHSSRVIDDRHFESMAIKGGVISISISWDCNLDYSPHNCKPSYGFSRLDNYGGNQMATGYNFRYADHNDDHRTLVKAFGILFLVQTDAIARAFNLQVFLVTLGSSMALLGLAPFIADIVLLRVHRNRKFFRQSKIEPDSTIQEIVNKPGKVPI
ncbi:P2X purinoceptor 5-like [Watersipora subatra]|uniref:P2X purinoceptor 5-like n=1 Tax=Watersipora subatra TaxID=2589382 RepID=UPI00355C34CD